MPPSNESAVVRGIYHWLTPLLIVALATIIGWLGSAIVRQQSQQNHTLTHIEVQMARLQSQLTYAQATNTAMQAEINAILTTQANHEHRITVLEDSRPHG